MPGNEKSKSRSHETIFGQSPDYSNGGKSMKKCLVSALLALMLMAVMVMPAMAETSNLSASVTVTEYASVTITDNGAAGLAETASPSITVTAAAENNIDVDIKLSGTDFSDGGTNSFTIANAFWNDENNSAEATAMSTTAATVATLSATESVSIYHWLSIPVEQVAATYTSTFTYFSE
jgi:hypothetical protein